MKGYGASMPGERGRDVGIGRFASRRVIDKHPRARCRGIGKGRLPKLGYKVKVVSDLAKSGVESAVIRLIPANSVPQRRVTETQLLARQRRSYLGSEMGRVSKIGALASKANQVGMPGKHKSARDCGVQTSTIDVRVFPGFRPTQKFSVANIGIIFQGGRIACFRAGKHLQRISEQVGILPGSVQPTDSFCNRKQRSPGAGIKGLRYVQLTIAICSQRPISHEPPCQLNGTANR